MIFYMKRKKTLVVEEVKDIVHHQYILKILQLKHIMKTLVTVAVH